MHGSITFVEGTHRKSLYHTNRTQLLQAIKCQAGRSQNSNKSRPSITILKGTFCKMGGFTTSSRKECNHKLVQQHKWHKVVMIIK